MVAILAGGKSRRMNGRDKANLGINGVPMLQHVAQTALSAGRPVVVVGRSINDFPDTMRQLNVEGIPDGEPDLGPIGGLKTALLSAKPGTSVLLCPCDLPLVKTESFTWLLEHAKELGSRSFHGIIPVWKGQNEPLFALYNSTVLELISELLIAENNSMQSLISRGNFKFINLPAHRFDAIKDADTPGDLSAFQMK